jgi:indole-3-glycerol phosphate synthase
MNILDQIIEQKKVEVAYRKANAVYRDEIHQFFLSRKPLSLKHFLLDENKTGIIAEYKRKSPSKGIINDRSDVVDVVGDYFKYGASGASVLTDGDFFGGAVNDVVQARTWPIPILRKDFIIDKYQIAEARSIGADVILLIAACLTPEEVKELAAFARHFQMEVLLEIHNEQELAHICDEIDLVGVNNRDLKTFTVDISRSIELSYKIPANKIKISESGLNDPKAIELLKDHGFRGFLIGENFMKEEDPGEAFRQFAAKMKNE